MLKLHHLALALTVSLIGCRHPVEIIGEGDVMSATGTRDCLLEQYEAAQENCTANEVAGAYMETYYAVARPGWQFTAWGNYCARSSQPDQCSFNISQKTMQDNGLESAPPLVAYFRREISGGYNTVLMGHSFFNPFAARLLGDARAAGFTDHSQQSFFSGGGGGAPIAFWNDAGANNANIKAALDAGGVSLFGMTYYPNPDRELNLQGYRNWIDYALKNNSDFTVFIGTPWSTEPGQHAFKDYKNSWKDFEVAEIHDFIDQLRRDYPELEFYCIPYGMGAIELKGLFETGKLPELSALIGEDSLSSVFTDQLGHPSDILVRLGSLIWLRAIYGVDLEALEYQNPYSTDLKAIAGKILNKHDHNYDAP